jgi:hypothetical protein
MATGLTVAEPCLLWWCVPRPALVGPFVEADEVSAAGLARSGPDEPSLLPPRSRAMPTTKRTAMLMTMRRRTQ